ncbi:hypothetical protein Lal_00046693 [Lupinus albus]|nr:hypothetical protein Lal_00046693 [Lupinus albus]
MEKRMESGKFVEGPEASTTVQESFTHPRNHIPIPEVSVDISIEDDALLPIPADDITTVKEVVGTFVTWLEHLIDVVPIMFLLNIPGKGESPPPQFYDSTINISIPEPIYGFYGQEFISINEVKDVHGRDWIGASVLSVYIRALNIYRGLNTKRQRPLKWTHVKRPLAKTITQIAAFMSLTS